MAPKEYRQSNHLVFCDLVAFNEAKIYPCLIEIDAGDRNRAIVSCYLRLYWWALSLRVLDGAEHFQAVSAGVRAMFEILVDLLWFEVNSEPVWVERFDKFSLVDRCRVAQRMREHERKHPASKGYHSEEYSQFLDNLDPADLAAAQTLWPDRKLIGLQHWTGHDRLPDRIAALKTQAKNVGEQAQELYCQAYGILCSDIHAGPTAILGKIDEQFEQQIAANYFNAFVYLDSGARTACELLSVDLGIPNLSQKMDELRGQMRFA